MKRLLHNRFAPLTPEEEDEEEMNWHSDTKRQIEDVKQIKQQTTTQKMTSDEPTDMMTSQSTTHAINKRISVKKQRSI